MFYKNFSNICYTFSGNVERVKIWLHSQTNQCKRKLVENKAGHFSSRLSCFLDLQGIPADRFTYVGPGSCYWTLQLHMAWIQKWFWQKSWDPGKKCPALVEKGEFACSEMSERLAWRLRLDKLCLCKLSGSLFLYCNSLLKNLSFVSVFSHQKLQKTSPGKTFSNFVYLFVLRSRELFYSF